MKSKTFLIAGCAGLLGSYLTVRLLQEGCKVIAFDIDLDLATSRLSGLSVDENNLELHHVDITNETEIKHFFDSLNGISIDGAVNATYPRNHQYGASFFDVSLESFNENLNLHLGSAFLFIQQCAKYFDIYRKPSDKTFSLVNVASIYGCVAPKFDIYENTSMTMPVEYAAIKSSIIHLGKYAAAYINSSLFRVNTISPGGLLDAQPKSFLDAYKMNTHGKGMLEVYDVLGSIIFLLSDESKFMTGQNLIVDDGFTL